MAKMTHSHDWQLVLAVVWEISLTPLPVATPRGLEFSQHSGWIPRGSAPRVTLGSGRKTIPPVLLEDPECHFHRILLAKAVSGQEEWVPTL